jgi:hypothetical protein
VRLQELSRDIRGTSIGFEIIQIGALDDCAMERDVRPRNICNVDHQKMPTEVGK